MKSRSIVPLAFAFAVLVACGAEDTSGSPSEGAGATSGGGGGGGAGVGGGGPTGDMLATGGPDGSVPRSPETCGDGIDNDGNGKIDEGCTCEADAKQKCYVGNPAQAGKGICAWGTQSCVTGNTGEFANNTWGACEGSGAPQMETCNGIDDDCDGIVDNGCSCKDGDTQACSTKCGSGNQVCTGGTWGDCDAQQPNANGGCTQKVNINIDGDCICSPACPSATPYVVGCNIDFQGGNSNGCVAIAKNGKVYFQEGVKCDEGHLSGYIECSDVPGPGLNAQNCPINKSNPHYGSKPSKCPNIESGTPDSCYY